MRELMAEIAKVRFSIIQQVLQEGLDAGELKRGDASVLALAFGCLMDQHINILSRLPYPKKHLTPESADWLVGLFLYGPVRPMD